jgi:hypothetical protein
MPISRLLPFILLAFVISFTSCVKWPIEPDYKDSFSEGGIQYLPIGKDAFLVKTVIFGEEKSANSVLLLDEENAFIIGAPSSPQNLDYISRYLHMNHQIKHLNLLMLDNHSEFVGSLIETKEVTFHIYVQALPASPLPDYKYTEFTTFNQNIDFEIGKHKILARAIPQEADLGYNIYYLPKLKLICSGNTTANIGEGLASIPNINHKTVARALDQMESEFPKANTIIPSSGAIGGREVIAYTKALIQENQ